MQLHLRLSSTSLLVVIINLAIGIVGCQPPEPPQVSRLAPLPQDPKIQVYMNLDAAASYTEPYRNYTRNGSNLEQLIIQAISTAHSSVDVAVQEFRLPGIAQALAERQRAGVKVRVVLEDTYSRPYSQFTEAEISQLPEREGDRVYESWRLIDQNQDGQLSQEEVNQRDALVILDRGQIPRIDDTADGSAGSNLMHHKFLVVDGRTVIVTSANFTTSDVHGDLKSQHSRGNANNLLKIESPELAMIFAQEFGFLWGDGPGGRTNSVFGVKKPFRPAQSIQVGSTLVQVQFSPSKRAIAWDQSTNGLIGRVLSSAKKSIQMALFVFSDQQLVNRLHPLHQTGIEVKTLIDPGFAYRSYSEGLDMMGISLADDCQVEASNRPWKPAVSTVGVPRMPPGDLLHHKFGIVDQQTIITGSHNWTDAANNGNDETVLVVYNSTVTAHYQREFERLYATAILGIPPAIQKKASAQVQHCQPKQPSPSTRKPTIEDQVAGASVAPPQQRVNLNTATLAELEELPGVGPGLAKRIVAARQKRRFNSLHDLDQVSGVGPKLLDKLKDRVDW